jgi:hypothetical protein
MNNRLVLYFCLSLVLLSNIAGKAESANPISNKKGQSVYQDVPYPQEKSVKYYYDSAWPSSKLVGISANRDGQIRILSDSGVVVPDNGSLFYAGSFTKDISYSQLLPKKIKSLDTYRNQTIYLDNKQIYSNAWAGTLQIDHGMPNASVFAGGEDFHFLVSDGDQLAYLDQSNHKLWSGNLKDVLKIIFDAEAKRFILVTPTQVAEFSPAQSQLKVLYTGSGITSAAVLSHSSDVVIGTQQGYLKLSDHKLITALPCAEITVVKQLNNQLWFGSAKGAFCLNEKGKYSYFAGERWLPGNRILDLVSGPENSILALTDKGLGQLSFNPITLEEKALFYEKQVREKNIRYGINCSGVSMPNGYSSGQTGNQPSDNLWTGMYLAAELFRFKVTGSLDAKENAFEAFEAMERFHTVTNIPGLFARSFERDYKTENTKGADWKKKELLSGSPASIWLPAADHRNWTWRSTASSDQTVAQVFAMTMILELSDDAAWKVRALKCLDNLMTFIVKNDLYIIDVDGEPTMWGKWNPDYVNKFPTNVGDRKITSSNIIAFLQTAYHYTHKQLFKDKAFELMTKYGYLDNLTRPFAQIGPNHADELSKVLSEEWNHSDDEMYFLAYWGLYPFAFSGELKEQFGQAIKDHWSVELPEHNALWNFTYAMTGAKDFDLDASIDFLKDYPIDMRNWAINNSERKDIELIPANFRGQTTKERLSLREAPLFRHNGQIFRLDNAGDGSTLTSAGDTWLLPYWMGRYLGVISAPIMKK